MALPPSRFFQLQGQNGSGWELCPSFPPGSWQIITDVIGNPEEERRAAFYHQPWAQEAVGRHIFAKVRLCPVCPPAVVSSRGLSCRALPSPGAAATAGTGAGAWNSPDLTAQGPPPLCPALEPSPPPPGRDHHPGPQTHRIRMG